MVEIGKFNTLRLVKEVDFGVYLDGDEYGEILLPKRYVPENYKVDDDLEVFIYLDSEDRIIATTEKPIVKVGEFDYLEVVSLSTVGAFLDWGLPKDLLLPYREQKQGVKAGQKVIVFVYLDQESNRLVASAKIDKFLDNTPPGYQPEEEVDLLICNETDLGYKAIVNNSHWGILYKNEVFSKIKNGQRTKAYIKKIREDEKIDLTLHKPGYEKIDDSAKQIIDYLKKNNGSMWLNDKSPSEEISKTFGISKKTFKKAIGNLYKSKIISINDNRISLM